jgi:hypothetical protein
MTWQEVFRKGMAPALSTPALLALKHALVTDEPTLLQGITTSPPPLRCVENWPVEAACLVAYGPWKGDGLRTVIEVEDAFTIICARMDLCDRTDKPACRHLLNWWDDTPRAEAVAALLPEVNNELRRRSPLYLRRDAEEVPHA